MNERIANEFGPVAQLDQSGKFLIFRSGVRVPPGLLNGFY